MKVGILILLLLSWNSYAIEQSDLLGMWNEIPEAECPLGLVLFSKSGIRESSAILCGKNKILAINYQETWKLNSDNTITFELIGGDENYTKLMGDEKNKSVYEIIELDSKHMILKSKETGVSYKYIKINETVD